MRISHRGRDAAVILILTLILSGCSVIKKPKSEPKEVQQKSSTVTPPSMASATLDIELFAARGFLGGSDYERYRLVKGNLWRECGKVMPKGGKLQKRKKLEGDQIFADDPNLAIGDRRVEELSPEMLTKFEHSAAELLPYMAKSKGKTPLPGSVFSLGAPGVFEMGVSVSGKKERLVTSVDAIAEEKPESAVLAKTRKLLESVRGVGQEICGSRTFFGIGRNSS